MRFCDFFLEYKLKVLSISPYIKWKDMEKYKLFGLGIYLLLTVGGLISFLFNLNLAIILFLLATVSILITVLLAERKEEKQRMLEKHFKPYSRERMRALFKLLKEYGIDYRDEKKMNMLIEQADLASGKNCLFKGIKPSVKYACTSFLVPVLIVALDHSMDGMKIDQLWNQIIQWGFVIVIFVILAISLGSLITFFLGGDSRKYEDLKYDLQQAMIFGNKQNLNINFN